MLHIPFLTTGPWRVARITNRFTSMVTKLDAAIVQCESEVSRRWAKIATLESECGAINDSRRQAVHIRNRIEAFMTPSEF